MVRGTYRLHFDFLCRHLKHALEIRFNGFEILRDGLGDAPGYCPPSLNCAIIAFWHTNLGPQGSRTLPLCRQTMKNLGKSGVEVR
jgi:hypothetical protein